MTETGKKYLVKSKKSLIAKSHSGAASLKQSLTNIPVWVRERPQAMKAWRQADRKKKKYRSFRLQKRIKPEPKPVPAFKNILGGSFKVFWQYRRIFFSLIGIHLVLYFMFVQSGANFNISQAQQSVESALGTANSLPGNLSLLGLVIGGQQGNSATAKLILLLFMSLAYIWALRRIYAGVAFKVRDALYQALAPAVPMVVLLVIMTLQALPFTIASYLYVVGRSSSLFVSGFEDLSFFLIAFVAGLLSLYWMTPTIIALYGVTLPNMYPLTTLRLSKKVVKFRRFIVFRRLVTFPIIAGLLYGAILLLCIRVAPAYSSFLAEVLPILLLPILHGYYFRLYRSLV